MDNEKAIIMIIAYINEHLFEPGSNWPKHWFDGRVYSRWAANEILERVMDHPHISAFDTIEEFYFKMNLFSAYSSDEKIDSIFLVALETASDILDMLYAAI